MTSKNFWFFWKMYILGKLLKIVIFFTFFQSFSTKCENFFANLPYILVKHVFFTHDFFFKVILSMYRIFCFWWIFQKKKEIFGEKNVFFFTYTLGKHLKIIIFFSFFIVFSQFYQYVGYFQKIMNYLGTLNMICFDSVLSICTNFIWDDFPPKKDIMLSVFMGLG